MKDIPMFITENGVASLVLREIPYRGEAHIRLQATQNPAELLEECVGFCRACGADHIDATGHAYLERFPLLTTVIEMCANVSDMEQTDALLFPVLQETSSKWRQIYNERMTDVPNASYMTEADMRKMIEKGDGYFVHRDGELLGIGRISGDNIDVVASVIPGAGKDVLLALASLVTGDTVKLMVANTNIRAVRLYENLGFITVRELSRWYTIL